MEYFIKTTLEAQTDAENQIGFILKKARFFDRYKNQLNVHQFTVIKVCQP